MKNFWQLALDLRIVVAWSVFLFFFPVIVWAETELTPSMPSIGSISDITAQNPNSAGTEPYNLDKMGARGQVFFDVLDDQGQPYPTIYTYIVDGKLVPVQLRFTVDVEKGDGVLLPNFPLDFTGLSPLILSVYPSYIRNKVCYEPSFPCSPEEKNLGDYANPLTPGPVYLRRILIEIVTADANATVVATNSYSTRTKLFTIANPPRITSVNKTSAKIDETVTVTGTNFDAPYVTTSPVDGIGFDVVPANNAGGYTSSRGISSTLNWWEDRVHYCGPTRVKFDWPPDIAIPPSSTSAVYTYEPMPTGPHTITFVNDFGWSNPVTVNFTGGQGMPENDPACRNEPGVITSISPTSGPPNTVVTINGTGFSNYPATYRGDVSDNAVAFGGVPADNSYLVGLEYERSIDPETGLPRYNGTQIEMRVPPGAKTGPVTVKPTGKYTIWGPTFTVMAGQGSPTLTPTPIPSGTPSTENEGGEVGTEPTQLPVVLSVFPGSVNIGQENYVLLQGSNLKGAEIVISDPNSSMLEVLIDEEGTSLRTKIQVSSASGAGLTLGVQNAFGRQNVFLNVKTPGLNSPQVSQAAVSSLNEQNRGTLVLTGSNFTGARVDIVGAGIKIESITTSATQITIGFLASGLYTQNSWSNLFGLLNSVQAYTMVYGVGTVTTVSGQSSFAVAVPQVGTSSTTSGQTGSGGGELAKWQIDNPFKGNPESLIDVIGIVANFIYQLGTPVAVIIIIIGGLMMLISGGVPAKFEKGKTMLRYAVIGLAILFIGKGFVSLIQSILAG